jgi:hypothetical protein
MKNLIRFFHIFLYTRLCCGRDPGYVLQVDGTTLQEGNDDDFGTETSFDFGSCGGGGGGGGGDNPSSPETPPPAQWEQIFFEGFEEGVGVFSKSGKQVSINTKKKYEGSASLRIKDDKSTSRAWTNDYDVSQYSKLKVNFFYMSVGVENDEGFALEYSVNDGSSWVEAKSFLKGEDWLVNKSWKEVSVEFDASDINSVSLQFRGDTSDRKDKIYIDNVLFDGMT